MERLHLIKQRLGKSNISENLLFELEEEFFVNPSSGETTYQHVVNDWNDSDTLHQLFKLGSKGSYILFTQVDHVDYRHSENIIGIGKIVSISYNIPSHKYVELTLDPEFSMIKYDRYPDVFSNKDKWYLVSSCHEIYELNKNIYDEIKNSINSLKNNSISVLEFIKNY